jgi:prevent-host-death family protein
MPKRYPIADARRNLAMLVREAEAGVRVELTRRATPVAVLVSVEQWGRLSEGRSSFAERYAEFRRRFPRRKGGVGPAFFGKLRDRAPGRKVDL